MAIRNRTEESITRRDTDSDLHRRGDGDQNRDPITGAPGAHPVGSGVGAAGGAVAGAAAGSIGGPLGVVAGGIVGGLIGGLAGKGVAEYLDPTEEHEYWRNEFRNRDYIAGDPDYELYAPAYQYGWESYSRYDSGDLESDTGARTDAAAKARTEAASTATTTGRSFDDVESDLRTQWDQHRGDTDLTWDKAMPATRDAWNRAHQRRSERTPASNQ